jgi:hypothetical protein
LSASTVPLREQASVLWVAPLTVERLIRSGGPSANVAFADDLLGTEAPALDVPLGGQKAVRAVWQQP